MSEVIDPNESICAFWASRGHHVDSVGCLSESDITACHSNGDNHWRQSGCRRQKCVPVSRLWSVDRDELQIADLTECNPRALAASRRRWCAGSALSPWPILRVKTLGELLVSAVPEHQTASSLAGHPRPPAGANEKPPMLAPVHLVPVGTSRRPLGHALARDMRYRWTGRANGAFGRVERET
jgi:hypothetical protein